MHYSSTNTIEQQILSATIAYQRQINLIGKPGYDPWLMLALKEDIAFLELEKSRMWIEKESVPAILNDSIRPQ